MKERITVFRPYEFEVGQKIFIEGGPRKGDWEVREITDRKLRLKCPISKKEFLWNRFCYAVEERYQEWPKHA